MNRVLFDLLHAPFKRSRVPSLSYAAPGVPLMTGRTRTTEEEPMEVPGPEATAADWLTFCEANARTVPDLTRRVELTPEQFDRLAALVDDERREPTELANQGHLGGWRGFEFWIPLGNGRKVRA